MRMEIYKCRYIWPWANQLLLNEICRYFNLLIQVSFENDDAMLWYKNKSYFNTVTEDPCQGIGIKLM